MIAIRDPSVCRRCSDPRTISQAITGETGLPFEAQTGGGKGGEVWIELHPAGYLPAETFLIRSAVGWRRIDIQLEMGAHAAELLAAMEQADITGRTLFSAVLAECVSDAATVEFSINGATADIRTSDTWPGNWSRLGLAIHRGMLPLNAGDPTEDERLILRWTGRMAAAVVALLPVEDSSPADQLPDVEGLPEGAKVRVEINRYERDRRNRAAALAIHGYGCHACQLNLEELYGAAAAGLIEVHHVTPVSTLGDGYVVNPAVDLVPLCPNCHAVAHRRVPPFSVAEIASMLEEARPKSTQRL
jgi:5-methylcytosine-specific restriction protein A